MNEKLQHIDKLYKKALSYQYSDPEASLVNARKAAEAICKQIYVQEISQNPGKLMLNELAQQLEKQNKLPKHIAIPVRTIQAYGNFGVHDQGADSQAVTAEYIQACLNALTTVVEWYFNEYHKVKKPTPPKVSPSPKPTPSVKFTWVFAIPVIVSIVALIIVGRIFFSPPPVIPIDIVAQLKQLQNPNAPVKVMMWLNEPGKMQFSTADDVILYYKIKGLSNDTTVYFSLFNISPAGDLSHFLFNKEIKGEEILKYPEAQVDVQPGDPLIRMVPQLGLDKGQEYFKAIVTSEPIVKEQFLATATKELQRMEFWGTEELVVTVD